MIKYFNSLKSLFSIIKFETILTNYLYGKIENVDKFSLAGFISGVKSVYKPEDVEIKICSNDNNIVEGIFFCFKNIIKEANTINKVIGVDSTFNVSKEKYPLLVITCVNKFYMTKVLAICFMLGEKTENYIFAFEAYLK